MLQSTPSQRDFQLRCWAKFIIRTSPIRSCYVFKNNNWNETTTCLKNTTTKNAIHFQTITIETTCFGGLQRHIHSIPQHEHDPVPQHQWCRFQHANPIDECHPYRFFSTGVVSAHSRRFNEIGRPVRPQASTLPMLPVWRKWLLHPWAAT